MWRVMVDPWKDYVGERTEWFGSLPAALAFARALLVNDPYVLRGWIFVERVVDGDIVASVEWA